MTVRGELMLSRRRFTLWLALAAAGLASRDAPVADWLPARLDGSFFQPWRADFDDLAIWPARFDLLQHLGCQQLILQWVDYVDGTDRFAASADTLNRLLDLAAARGLALRIGLPFDNGYWAAAAADEPKMDAHLKAVLTRQTRHIETASYAQHPAFAGWYLPQELDDYTWRRSGFLDRLLDYLSTITAAVAGHDDRLLAVSTFHSAFAASGVWPDLWSAILQRVALVPLIQDGAGVAAPTREGHSAASAQLAERLRADAKPFELIIELFEQLDRDDGRAQQPFTARAASFARVRTQLERAVDLGPGRILGFAVDPYMTDRVAGGKALRRAYLLAALDPRTARVEDGSERQRQLQHDAAKPA